MVVSLHVRQLKTGWYSMTPFAPFWRSQFLALKKSVPDCAETTIRVEWAAA
ncbi:hypothetical protein SGH10_001749 [Klebsiella pneumoniae]|nr:Hypothetical protein EAG7_00696 [Klebsiella aerogenes]AUB47128.1 hypothetical protein SGH10_001749 [Klebsiella pneumoniae]EOY84770.1 hypothetical protein H232_4875 [Klebsiella pneumoniae UHKPC81]CCG29252.1 hypothetical protein [Klebsiella aerogenes EA1509E]